MSLRAVHDIKNKLKRNEVFAREKLEKKRKKKKEQKKRRRQRETLGEDVSAPCVLALRVIYLVHPRPHPRRSQRLWTIRVNLTKRWLPRMMKRCRKMRPWTSLPNISRVERQLNSYLPHHDFHPRFFLLSPVCCCLNCVGGCSTCFLC